MSAWARLSIATKLPLGAAAILLLVLGGMTADAYVVVRRAAIRAAADRLGVVANLLASSLHDQAVQRSAVLDALAREPAMLGWATTGDTAEATKARARLQAYLDRNPAGAAMELWDSTGTRTFAVGQDLPPVETAMALVRAAAASRETRPGPFQLVNDSVTYAYVAALAAADARPAGYLVERRRAQGTQQALQLLSDLFGGGAQFRFGTPGGLWTDLIRTVDAPPIASPVDSALLDFRDGDSSVLARAAAIEGTPWILLAESPKDLVLSGANRFLTRAITASLLLALAGAFVAWLLSRRITKPLQTVTLAAEAITAGRSAPRLASRRADEVGRLETSFNIMADQVEQGRMRLEQRVAERTTELEHANRELEAFSYSVSHDLRAPLRAIDGFARILTEDHGAQLSPEAAQRLSTIQRNARHMGQLIDDLLAFSRLSRYALSRKSVAMEKLAGSAIDAARHDHPERAIDFDLHPMPDATGEPALLEQVFTNLVQNAVKFTRPRSPATIEVGYTENAGDGAGAYYVSDNGVGFDMRYADKLFGVFQRLHRPDEFEGTGVGLALVQRIVHRHGGRVWAEAALDRGATFFFTIPEATDHS